MLSRRGGFGRGRDGGARSDGVARLSGGSLFMVL